MDLSFKGVRVPLLCLAGPWEGHFCGKPVCRERQRDPERDEPTEAGARAAVSRAALITEPTADTPWRVLLLL